MPASNYQPLLFKSDQRGSIDTEGYKCYSTFNFGDYQQESRTPAGAIRFLNDVSIGPGNTVYFNRDENIQDLILPLTGSLNYKSFYTPKDTVSPEHVLFLNSGTDHAYDIENAYENDWVNYLHIGLKRNAPLPQTQTTTHAINFTAGNTFASLNTDQFAHQFFGAKGVFKGLTKDKYALKNQGNGIFAYIINGSFEVEGLVMEQRDGLCLLNKKVISFESLSENAVLLLLEFPLEIS